MKKPLFFLSISTVLLLLPQVSAAGTWDDLWLRQDQQGEHALKANKPSEAAKLFENPEWQGVAEYRSGQYNKALNKFSDKNAPLANYNRGNVLAQLEKYKEAIKAYEKALAQQENYPDAAHNIEVLKKLLNDKNDQKSSSKQQKNDQQQQQKKK